MRKPVATLFVALSVLTADVASADSFSLDGAFTTRGVFHCLSSLACTGSGTNTVVLGSGDNVTTLTFTGVDTTVAIGNTSTSVNMGTFESSASEAFTFPTRPNPNIPILRFNLSISHTSPVVDTNTLGWLFGPGGRTNLPFMMGPIYTSFPLSGSYGPGYNYDRFVYSFAYPFRIAGSGLTSVTADVGVVPEPATVFLVGAGLAGAIARRRVRRAAQARPS